jgi:cytochrome P450 family 26 subfamily A
LSFAILSASGHYLCFPNGSHVCFFLTEQEEIAKVKAGAPLNWEDTQKMKYTWWVMQETLRLQSPVAGAFRESLKEFEYGGFRIPKGCKVIFVWASEIGARP